MCGVPTQTLNNNITFLRNLLSDWYIRLTVCSCLGLPVITPSSISLSGAREPRHSPWIGWAWGGAPVNVYARIAHCVIEISWSPTCTILWHDVNVMEWTSLKEFYSRAKVVTEGGEDLLSCKALFSNDQKWVCILYSTKLVIICINVGGCLLAVVAMWKWSVSPLRRWYTLSTITADLSLPWP